MPRKTQSVQYFESLHALQTFSDYKTAASEMGVSEYAVRSDIKNLEIMFDGLIVHEANPEVSFTALGEELCIRAELVITTLEASHKTTRRSLLKGDLAIAVDPFIPQEVYFDKEILNLAESSSYSVDIQKLTELDAGRALRSKSVALVAFITKSTGRVNALRGTSFAINWCGQMSNSANAECIPIAVRPKGCPIRHMALSDLTAKKIPYQVVLETSDTSLLLDAASDGLITAVPEFVKTTVPRFKLLEQVGECLRCEIALHQDKTEANPFKSAYRDILLKRIKDL